MNPNCRSYALPSLCMSVLPICRTPEETNHIYFLNKAKSQPLPPITKKSKKSNKKKTRTTKIPTTTSTTTSAPFVNQDQDQEVVTEFIARDFATESSLRYNNLRKKRHYSNTRQFYSNNDFDILSIKSSYPPSRSSENLRRICREDCELLENELCQKEYAIAKRHPTIGLKLPLEDCWDVPEDEDCLRMGITIDIAPEGKLYLFLT